MGRKKSDNTLAQERVAAEMNKRLKSSMVSNMAKGGAIVAHSILDMIHSGESIEAIESFCNGLVSSQDMIK